MRLLKTPVFVVIGTQLVLFVPLAMLRTVDADEGFYVLASRLVFEGRVPYSDFLYTQTPLLPYMYGAWMAVFGFNWYDARLLSALLATTLGTLLFLVVQQRTASTTLGWFAFVLYATSAFALAWNTVVMTYALSGVLLFGAFACLETCPRFLGRTQALASGLLLGLAIDTRSLMLAAVPAFLWWFTRRARRELVQWSSGLLIGLAPILFFLAANPAAFIFGNIGFHAFRNDSGLIANWTQKLAIVTELLNIHSSGGETITYQVPFLLALNSLYVVLVVRRRAQVTLPLLITLLVGFALLLPTPTYTQYFVILLPFVIVTTADAIRHVELAVLLSPAGQMREHLRAAVGVFVAVYMLAVPVVLYRYVSWIAAFGPGLQHIDPSAWSLPAIRQVSAAIDATSTPGDQVMTWWPGYLFETRTSALPGTENHGWMELAGRAQPLRPPIATPDSIHQAIVVGGPRLLVFGILAQNEYRDFAQSRGYAVVETIGGADLFEQHASTAVILGPCGLTSSATPRCWSATAI